MFRSDGLATGLCAAAACGTTRYHLHQPYGTLRYQIKGERRVSTLKGAARAEKRIPRAGKKSPAQPGPSVRERLLDAAFEAFMEHGYAGASTLDTFARVAM